MKKVSLGRSAGNTIDYLVRWLVGAVREIELASTFDIRQISNLWSGTQTFDAVRITGTDELTLASTTHPFQIGADASANLSMDTNEIQVRSNGAAAALALNPHGGDVSFGANLSAMAGYVDADAALGYKLDGTTVITRGSIYTLLYDPDSTQCIALGGSLDQTNYYDNSSHVFRSSSFSNYATINASGLNLTGGQIVFPATQSASTNANTLDDYEEGTWTPNLTFDGLSTGITYNQRQGRYTKLGLAVLVWAHFVLTSKGSATGGAFIDGLPFTPGTGSGWYNGSVGFGFTGASVLVPSGTARLNVYINQSSGANNTYFTNTMQFICSAQYEASA